MNIKCRWWQRLVCFALGIVCAHSWSFTRCTKIAQKRSVVEKHLISTPIYTHAPRFNEHMTLLRSYNSSHDPGSAQHRVQVSRWNIRMKHSAVWLTWLTASKIIPILITVVSRLVSFTFNFFPLLHGQDFARPCPFRPTLKAAACNDSGWHICNMRIRLRAWNSWKVLTAAP